MGPREEDNSLLLLGAVTVICGLIAFVPALLEPAPAIAGNPSYAKRSSIEANALAPARVIVPFTPNTIPSDR